LVRGHGVNIHTWVNLYSPDGSELMSDVSQKTNSLVVVDVVLFTIQDRRLHVLLINRRTRPHAGRYALPGGFLREGESLDGAAVRELREDAGMDKVYLEQLYTFDDPKRAPESRVITVTYYALVPPTKALKPGPHASEAAWLPVDGLPALAFGQNRIVEYALSRVRNKLDYTNVGFELLPAKFTLTDLQSVHEAILGQPLDKRNFRRKVAQKGIVEPTSEWAPTGHKPAQLYRFLKSGGK